MYQVVPLIQGSAVANTATVYYTSPTGTYTRITQFSLTNTDTAPRTVSIYVSAGSSAPATADTIVKAKTLAVNETYVPYQVLGVVLAPAGSLQIVCDAASVVIAKASGIQLS